MALPRLEPSARIGDQAFDVLQSAIIDGDLPAGRRLRIRELADELGTSVMPVREAIARLEEVGLVETAPRRSAVVKSFTNHELLDLYSVRRLLEVEAAVLGVRELTSEAIDRMRAEFDAMCEALQKQDPIGYLAHDEDFLMAMYAAARNVVLTEMIRMLWYRCRSYKLVGAKQSLHSGAVEALTTFQRDLLAAARDHDAERAGTITADSLQAATARIEAGLGTTDGPGRTPLTS